MAVTIRKVEYFKVLVPNKVGVAAKYFATLKAARVSLLAFTGFPRGARAQLDFIPGNAAAFKKALRKAGVSPGRGKFAFLIQGADRPGALAEVAAKLHLARINITTLDAVAAGGGRFGAILWVKARDVARTSKALRKR